MATQDVPGAKASNGDTLAVGAWSEDKAGTSLMFVAGLENDQVVYQMYDLTNGMFYQDAMLEKDFKKEFSGKDWTWHDKTSFPWNRVMARFNRPVPQHADVEDQLTTAGKVAKALHLRGRKLTEADVTARSEELRARGFEVMGTIAEAIGKFMERGK